MQPKPNGGVRYPSPALIVFSFALDVWIRASIFAAFSLGAAFALIAMAIALIGHLTHGDRKWLDTGAEVVPGFALDGFILGGLVCGSFLAVSFRKVTVMSSSGFITESAGVQLTKSEWRAVERVQLLPVGIQIVLNDSRTVFHPCVRNNHDRLAQLLKSLPETERPEILCEPNVIYRFVQR